MNNTIKDIIDEINSLSKEELESILAEIREKVGKVDKEIVELLGKRFYYSKIIGKLKAALNLPVHSLQREKKLIDNLLKNLPSGLSQKSLIRIYERILDESRTVQRSQIPKK